MDKVQEHIEKEIQACKDCDGSGEIYWEDGDDLHGGPCPTCNKEVSP